MSQGSKGTTAPPITEIPPTSTARGHTSSIPATDNSHFKYLSGELPSFSALKKRLETASSKLSDGVRDHLAKYEGSDKWDAALDTLKTIGKYSAIGGLMMLARSQVPWLPNLALEGLLGVTALNHLESSRTGSRGTSPPVDTKGMGSQSDFDLTVDAETYAHRLSETSKFNRGPVTVTVKPDDTVERLMSEEDFAKIMTKSRTVGSKTQINTEVPSGSSSGVEVLSNASSPQGGSQTSSANPWNGGKL